PVRGRLHPRLRRPDAERGLHGRLPARRGMNAISQPASRLPREARLILSLWFVLSAIAVPLIVLVLGPHLPPGNMSTEAADETDASSSLTALVAPIVILFAVYFAYSLPVFRARGDELEDGPPIHGH